MNPIMILALIGDLYAQIAGLRQENEALRQQVAATATSSKQATPSERT